MSFTVNQALTATDMNNTWRGYYRDNANHATTGVTTAVVLATVAVGANTVSSTGMLRVLATGTVTGTAGGKTIVLTFGGSTIATVTTASATTTGWTIDAYMVNTATNAQRWLIYQNVNDLTTIKFVYTTSAIDTTASQTLNIQGTTANAGDTITQSLFDVFVCQIT